jgi:hypothetical protein
MVMGANIRMPYLPAEYRWASALETEVFDTLPDAIQVIVAGNDEDGSTMTDIAVPAAYPVMFDIRDDGTVYDCVFEFDEHTDHKECPNTMYLVNTDEGDYDPMMDIPFGVRLYLGVSND